MDRQTLNIIIMVAVFGLVFSFWTICVLLWLTQTLSRSKLFQKRIDVAKEGTSQAQIVRLWRDKRKEVAGIEKKKATLQERLERLKVVTGWRMSAQVVLLGVGAASIIGFFLTYISTRNLVLSLSISVAIVVIFWRYILVRISKYMALLDVQLVDGLGICARALRAGLPLMGSFQLISEEIDKPIGDIFHRICREQMMGTDLKDSIKKIAKTVPSPELQLFSTSIAIQLQSGGNLAELMESLSSVIRSRMRLNRRVRILTAQTQLSKRILIALPIGLFLLLSVIAPTYMTTFYTTKIGNYLLIIMGVMILFGAWVMNKIAIVKF